MGACGNGSNILRPWGFEKVNEDTKKSLIIGAILFVVGATLGLLLSGNIRGLLAGAAGLLPAVSGLGAADRSNRKVVESVGAIREGLDSSTEQLDSSIEHIESAQGGIRDSVETLRGAARPVGAPIDPDNSSSHSSRDSHI